MDFVRSCYTTEMQFDQAGLLKANVRWYFADKDAKLWHGPNAFCSSIWDEVKYSTVGIGETIDVIPKWSNGKMPYPSLGAGRFCGKHRWFSEGAPSDAPPLTRGSSGQPQCCPGGSGLLIGGTSTYKNVYITTGGLKIGAKSTVIGPTVCQPYSDTFHTTATCYRVSTGTFWPISSWTTGAIQFADPILGVFNSAMNLTTSVFSCGSHSLSNCYWIDANAGGLFRANALQSYNAGTFTGTWKAAFNNPFYPNEIFLFFLQV